MNIPGSQQVYRSERRAVSMPASTFLLIVALFIFGTGFLNSCAALFRESEANRAPDPCLSAGGHYETTGRIPYTSVKCVGTP